MKTAILAGALALATMCQVTFGAVWLRSATIHMPDSASWCEALGCDGY